MNKPLAALTQLMVEEVSLCRLGKNPGAQVLLVKSGDNDLDESAQLMKALFNDVLEQIKFRDEARKITEPIWDMISLLTMSFTQILADDDRYPNKREAMKASVSQMAEHIQGIIDRVINKSQEKDMDHEKIIKQKDQEIARLSLLASLTDAEKDYLGTLEKSDQEGFLAKGKSDRLAEVNKALEGDESIVLHGATIKKSVVGEAAFTVMKAQAEEIAEIKKANAELKYIAKAETELSHIPGEIVEKAAVLQAVDEISDAEIRKNVYAILEKCNEAMKVGVFKEIGTPGQTVDVKLNDVNTPEGAGEQLEILAKAVAEEQNISVAKAYDIVLETREGIALYETYKSDARFLKAGGTK